MTVSDFVTKIQRKHGLSDSRMCRALVVNLSTLTRLKNGKFDSEARIIDQVEKKVQEFVEKRG